MKSEQMEKFVQKPTEKQNVFRKHTKFSMVDEYEERKIRKKGRNTLKRQESGDEAVIHDEKSLQHHHGSHKQKSKIPIPVAESSSGDESSKSFESNIVSSISDEEVLQTSGVQKTTSALLLAEAGSAQHLSSLSNTSGSVVKKDLKLCSKLFN